MNVEYRSITYKTNDDICGTALSKVNEDLVYNAIIIGFSLPFVLLILLMLQINKARHYPAISFLICSNLDSSI